MKSAILPPAHNKNARENWNVSWAGHIIGTCVALLSLVMSRTHVGLGFVQVIFFAAGFCFLCVKIINAWYVFVSSNCLLSVFPLKITVCTLCAVATHSGGSQAGQYIFFETRSQLWNVGSTLFLLLSMLQWLTIVDLHGHCCWCFPTECWHVKPSPPSRPASFIICSVFHASDCKDA